VRLMSPLGPGSEPVMIGCWWWFGGGGSLLSKDLTFCGFLIFCFWFGVRWCLLLWCLVLHRRYSFPSYSTFFLVARKKETERNGVVVVVAVVGWWSGGRRGGENAGFS